MKKKTVKKYAYIARTITIDQIAWLEYFEKYKPTTKIDYIDMILFEIIVKCWNFGTTRQCWIDTWQPSDGRTIYTHIQNCIIANALPLLKLSKYQIKRRIDKLIAVKLLNKKIRHHTDQYLAPSDQAYELNFRLTRVLPAPWQVGT